jgi:hypothetical protein
MNAPLSPPQAGGITRAIAPISHAGSADTVWRMPALSITLDERAVIRPGLTSDWPQQTGAHDQRRRCPKCEITLFHWLILPVETTRIGSFTGTSGARRRPNAKGSIFHRVTIKIDPVASGSQFIFMVQLPQLNFIFYVNNVLIYKCNIWYSILYSGRWWWISA